MKYCLKTKKLLFKNIIQTTPLLYQKRRWANRFFFSLENQNSANTIRNTSFIPSPHVYLLLYFLSHSILLHVYLLLCSLSPRALNSLFLLLLRSSSRLPGNNSPFLFCWIYVIDWAFYMVGYMIVWIWNQNFRIYFGWKICYFCCFCFFMGCGFIWVFGCFWDLPILGFDYNYCLIFVDT